MDGLEPLPELKCTRCPWSSNLDTDFQGLMAVRGSPFFTQPLSRPPRPLLARPSPSLPPPRLSRLQPRRRRIPPVPPSLGPAPPTPPGAVGG